MLVDVTGGLELENVIKWFRNNYRMFERAGS
jgi:hypothetical protein